MARKYLGRKDKSLDLQEKESIDNLDPFEATERQIDLKFEESNSELDYLPIKDTKDEIQDTTKFLETTTEELQKRVERVKKLKKLHENFDSQIEVLQNNTIPKHEPIELSPELEPESIKISKNIVSILEKTAEQKARVMALQLEAEKKQAEKVNRVVRENMNKIIEVPKELRKKIGDETAKLIEENNKRKIKLMELQLKNEIKQSELVNNQVNVNMDEIVKLEDEMRFELEKLELEVKDKTEKLLKAERLSAIGELAARVAHDLRNPLSVIKASVELVKVKNQKDPQDYLQRQIGMIERSIGRMSHQIEDVLDFVKPIPIHVEKHSFLETLNAAIEKAKISKDILITIPSNDVKFEFDKEKIDVVLDNLLTNASQAINGKGKINVRISEDTDTVCIEIEDSGPGIPEELLPKIFDPLVTTKQAGTGLGLASCRSLIEQHGGIITAKNNPTTFTITLPKKPKNTSKN